MKKVVVLLAVTMLAFSFGCSTPNSNIGKMELGMTKQDVRKVMGNPFAIRAAKSYENKETSEVWEYMAPIFSAAAFSDKYDRNYWILFYNGKVIQWGEPGDFSGATTLMGTAVISDYIGKRK